MRPRAAMMTLYGDYVRHGGKEIGIGSLVKLLGNFDLSEQSVRSAVSRMCRGGLLKVRHENGKSYYSLTDEGMNLLGEGRRRVFKQTSESWNGYWSVVVYFIPEEKRKTRDTLRQEMKVLGYGPLSTATWISPHDVSKEVERLARKLKIKEYVQIFVAKHLGLGNEKALIARCWDLDRIHKRYDSFITEYRAKLDQYRKRLSTPDKNDSGEGFKERFKLLHEYRRLPYLDPDLPESLLPENWLRSQARALFYEYQEILTEDANKYLNAVIKDYQFKGRKK